MSRKPRIAVNGFGRIGRMVTRISKLRKLFDVIAVNDLTDAKTLAHLFEFDTAHGRYPGEVSLDGNTMTVDGDSFEILSERDPAKLPWKELEIDYVIESTGIFRRIAQLENHLAAGAKRVLVTVPLKDPLESTVVLGVNEHVLTEDARIISNASCTTNCAAPVAKVVNDAFGVRRGLLTTVHAYTADQRIVDGPHKDLRRARAAAANIVPTSTGAARAVGIVVPELAGKFDGMAMRVPIPDGSLIDFTIDVERETTAEEVVAALQKAADGPMAGILDVEHRPLVSSDIVSDPRSSIVDAELTQVIDGTMVKIVSWYDNEYGYSSRVAELVGRVAKLDGLG